MPTLNWIGKDKVLNLHRDVPFRTLEKTATFGDADSGNMIIHGDNLAALKALLPEYEGKIKCIYIDPPYNTGNEGWAYNDNVNAPQIRRWLGEVVGKEGEDLSRHDKWLCMMYPRLQLLQRLLSDDGAIFISIDDNEQANLKLICDEIFGAGNFVDIFSWHKTYSPSNLSNKSKKCLEYVYCYVKHFVSSQRFSGLLKTNPADNPLLKSNNQYKKLRFPCKYVISTIKDNYYKAGVYGTKVNKVTLLNDVELKDYHFMSDFELEGKFIWTQEYMDNEIANGTKIVFKGNSFAPRYDRVSYKPEVPRNLIDKDDFVGTTEEGGSVLENIFGKKVFDYPKPPSLIEYIIGFLCNQNSLILDSFAGSGTTAHAVLNLNKKDGGNRKFILVEMEDYADSITAERVRRVIKGYGEGKNAVEGTGGGFSFYELGEPIFADDGNLNEAIGTQKIRQYIWYSETGTPLTHSEDSYFLGTHNATDYYFYYEPNQETILTRGTLGEIVRQKADSYIIYADACQIEKAFLQQHNITFKRIPRDIKKL